MCGYVTKFHYPFCPKCRQHRILSRRHIQCRFCAAKGKVKVMLAGRARKQADTT